MALDYPPGHHSLNPAERRDENPTGGSSLRQTSPQWEKVYQRFMRPD